MVELGVLGLGVFPELLEGSQLLLVESVDQLVQLVNLVGVRGGQELLAGQAADDLASSILGLLVLVGQTVTHPDGELHGALGQPVELSLELGV